MSDLIITTRPDFEEGGEEHLKEHGCIIEIEGNIALIAFPSGTTVDELFPRTTMQRNKLLFPDGFCLVEIYNPYNGMSSLAEVKPEHVTRLKTISSLNLGSLVTPKN